MLNLAINIVTIFAVLAGLAYAWRLDRKLRDLDKARGETEKFLSDFTSAIARAERAIRQLQDTAMQTGSEIDQQFSKAIGLRDELTFLVDAADKIATRLTDKTSLAQSDAQARRAAAPPPEPKAWVETVAPAKMEAPPPLPPVPEAISPVIEKNDTLRLPAWLKPVAKVVEGGKAKAEKVLLPVEGDGLSAKNAADELPRSQAERELQQALEKMR
jgi:hypothetical protein